MRTILHAKSKYKDRAPIILTGENADSSFIGFESWLKLDLDNLKMSYPRHVLGIAKPIIDSLEMSFEEFSEYYLGLHQRKYKFLKRHSKDRDIKEAHAILSQLSSGLSWQKEYLFAGKYNKVTFVSPFYDFRMLGFAFGLPLSCKVKSGVTKYMLRKMLKKYADKNLSKTAFPHPARLWSLIPNGNIISDEMLRKTFYLHFKRRGKYCQLFFRIMFLTGLLRQISRIQKKL